MYKFFRREILSLQEIVQCFFKKNHTFKQNINFSTVCFFAVLILKVMVGAFLASTFLSELFLPFVDYFIESGFKNPYSEFSNSSSKLYFPYPALMLYILTVPKLLFGWIAPNSIFYNLMLLRIPILVADLSIFFVLKSWLHEKFHDKLVYLYWMSPVLFYIGFVHGQLDVIPIALLFVSLSYLFKSRPLVSAVVFGLALSAKTHVLLIYPFFFLYMLSKHVGFKVLLQFFLLTVLTFVGINLPFAFEPGFLQTVFLNQESLKLFSARVTFNSLEVYVFPAAMLIVFVRGVLLKHYNKDVFLMFLGFCFSIVLLLIPPMPGWYYWLMPFLCYFYVKKNGKSHFIYLGLSLGYMMYFALIKESDFIQVFEHISPSLNSKVNLYTYFSGLGLDIDKGVNLAYTFLQTTMLVNCFWIYREGLENSRKDKIVSSPFLIGIGGNSGVGKTTISNALMQVFKPYNTVVLRGDDMHKWSRGHQKWNELTHLDPKANHLHKEVNFLKKLKSGQKIFRRSYDHSTGQFTSEKPLKPNNLIIYEGLHPFYLPSQRYLYDLKVFLKPSTDLMHHWKILRDSKKRGYSKEKVLDSIKKRERDSGRFIDIQKDKADFIIEVLPVESVENIGEESVNLEVSYKLTLSNTVYIEPLIDSLASIKELNINHWYTEDDRQIITILGNVECEDINAVSAYHFRGLEDLGIENPDWPKGVFGVLILTLSYYILEKSKL